jgi:hypothetical protein
MRKLLLGALLLLSTLSFSQPRVNEQRIDFDKIGNKLETASGFQFWKHRGEWSEYKTSKEGCNRLGYENFYYMFFTEMTYNTEKFYILNIKSIDGSYKYPAIKQGFYSFYTIRSYIFNQKEYNNLKNYKSGKSSISFETTDYSSKKSIEELMDDIRINTLNAIKNNYGSKNELLLKIENDNLIRFILPLMDKTWKKDWGFDKLYWETTIENFSILFKL